MTTKPIFAFLVALLSFSACTQTEQQSQTQSVSSETTTTVEKDLLRHVVLFKFKDTSSPEDVKKVEDAFLGLTSKIKEIKDLEWGLNNSPEGHDQGFTHCFFVTFESEEDRAIYLPHPDHKAFVDILGPHLDKVLVFDYWTK
jgi:hypothetical protein